LASQNAENMFLICITVSRLGVDSVRFRYFHSIHLVLKQCMKILPYAIGILVLFFLLFSLWVRSIPPKTISVPPVNATATSAGAFSVPQESASDPADGDSEMTITEDL